MSSDEEAVIETRDRSLRLQKRAEKHSQRAESNKRPRFLGDGDSEPEDLFGGLDDVEDIIRDDREGSDALLGEKDVAGEKEDNLWNGEGEADGVATKKRRVIAKMDEVRLLGPDGFPKLQELASKFKTKGKGNEVQDLKRVMTMYQLWAHQMYPKTNLRDTLGTVERLCHKRSVQRALKGYRELERPKALRKKGDGSASPPRQRSPTAAIDKDPFAAEPTPAFEASGGNDEEFDRLYPPTADGKFSGLDAGSGNAVAGPSGSRKEKEIDFEEDAGFFDNFDEDEEAMLREMEESATQTKAVPKKVAVVAPVVSMEQQQFNEEEEAMLREMEDMM